MIRAVWKSSAIGRGVESRKTVSDRAGVERTTSGLNFFNYKRKLYVAFIHRSLLHSNKENNFEQPRYKKRRVKCV